MGPVDLLDMYSVKNEPETTASNDVFRLNWKICKDSWNNGAIDLEVLERYEFLKDEKNWSDYSTSPEFMEKIWSPADNLHVVPFEREYSY